MDYNITYRQKDKGIQCIISYKDNNGKWKQGFKTQKEAKPLVAEMIKELETQLKKLEDGTTGFGSLKSTHSYRKVPVSNNTLKVLNEYKSTHPIPLNNRIVSYSYDCINSYLNPILTEISSITIHELRHTYITLLISNGIDFKTVAKIAGNYVKQTIKIYSHVTDEMMKNAQDKISKFF